MTKLNEQLKVLDRIRQFFGKIKDKITPGGGVAAAGGGAVAADVANKLLSGSPNDPAPQTSELSGQVPTVPVAISIPTTSPSAERISLPTPGPTSKMMPISAPQQFRSSVPKQLSTKRIATKRFSKSMKESYEIVGRPNSDKSKLRRQGEILRKIIDEESIDKAILKALEEKKKKKEETQVVIRPKLKNPPLE